MFGNLDPKHGNRIVIVIIGLGFRVLGLLVLGVGLQKHFVLNGDASCGIMPLAFLIKCLRYGLGGKLCLFPEGVEATHSSQHALPQDCDGLRRTLRAKPSNHGSSKLWSSPGSHDSDSPPSDVIGKFVLPSD